MLPENVTAILARNERWSGNAATEPYEAGWACEAIVFVRALKSPVGQQPRAHVEISPDGMNWIPEGSEIVMPGEKDDIAMARLRHFGNWLRVTANFAPNCEAVVLVTLHLKA